MKQNNFIIKFPNQQIRRADNKSKNSVNNPLQTLTKSQTA